MDSTRPEPTYESTSTRYILKAGMKAHMAEIMDGSSTTPQPITAKQNRSPACDNGCICQAWRAGQCSGNVPNISQAMPFACNASPNVDLA